MTASIESGQITVSWSIDAEAVPPVGYEAEVQMGPDASWIPGSGAVDVAARTLTAPDPMLPTDLDIPLRVRATGDGGSAGDWSETYLLHIPGHPIPNSERFDITGESTVIEHQDLVDAGLTTWPNGQLGILPSPNEPGSFDFYADQGDERDQNGVGEAPGYAISRGTLADPVQQVVANHAHIQGVKEPADFIGGGRVWRDPVTSSIVMFYQRKEYTAGGGMYASVGAARSLDDGATFTDLGVVLTPQQPFDADQTQYVGPGDAAPIVVGADLYVYFGDTLTGGVSTGTSVARISLADLRSAVAAGTAPVFTKWNQDAFSSPGLGGASSAVLSSDLQGDGWNPDVIYSSCRRELVMVANVAVGATSQVVMATSPDGLHWSDPATLYDSPSSFRIFNTLVPDDLGSDRVVDGATFSMLTVTFPGPTDFWSGASVERVELVDHVAQSEGCLDPPTPVDLATSIASEQITFSWQIDPAVPAPIGYEVENRVGSEGPWTPTGGTLDVAARTVTAPDPMLQFDLDISLHVRSVDIDGRRSAWSDVHVLHLPGHPMENSDRFDVVSDVELVGHQRLIDLGMDTWPDGQIGILPSPADPTKFDFYANQGDGSEVDPGIGHTRGTLADPLQQVVTSHGQIQGLQNPSDYVGGGRVFKDPDTGTVVMIYHREQYTAGGTFYATLGMARSLDGGVTFTDLGLILTPTADWNPASDDYIGPGDAAFVVVDGQMYIYFTDNDAAGQPVGTTVARASMASVLDAVADGEAPTFTKWHQGAFSTAGIGGASSSVVDPILGGSGWNADVIYSSCRREFVMVANSEVAGGMGVVVMTSPNGVDWSSARTLYDVPPQYRIYNTLIPDDLSDGKVVRGASFSMLSVTFPSPTDFWSGASIDRVSIVDRVAEEEGCIAELSVSPQASGLEPDDGSTAGAYVRLSLSRPRDEPTVVSYWTSNGTATDLPTAPGGVGDYVRFGTPAAPRTVTIPAGTTSKGVALPIRSDGESEEDENFHVHIATAASDDLRMGNASSEVTILDADARSQGGNPILMLTPIQTVGEGDELPGGVAQVYLRLSKPLAVPFSVSYWTSDGSAKAGRDYQAKGPYTLTFQPGATSKTIDVLLKPNRTPDGDRSFAVNYSLLGALPPGTVVVADPVLVGILDDEP